MALALLICLVAGCIQGDEEDGGAAQSVDGLGTPSGVGLVFNPEVSASLLRAQGSLRLSGSGSDYVILDATLMKDGSVLENTRYMMMDLKPGVDYPFDISESMRISEGNYSCALAVIGPDGNIANETRGCRVRGSLKPPEGGSKEKVDDMSPPRDFARFYEMGREDALDEIEREDRENDRENEKAEDSGVSGKSGDVDEASGGDDEPEVSYSSGDLIASSTATKYHRPDCRYVAKIKPENKITFNSKGEAEDQGYEACKVCNP
jgi:hypothetical protein